MAFTKLTVLWLTSTLPSTCNLQWTDPTTRQMAESTEPVLTHLNDGNPHSDARSIEMTAPVALPRGFLKLFADPSNNPLGTGDAEKAGHTEIFLHWRSWDRAPAAEEALEDALLDLDQPVGAMCAFVESPDHQTGALKVVHAPRRFTGIPGKATPARGKIFAHSGDVEGVDIDAIALDA